ncbi:hypothetical protein HPB50_016645 [Hyalomma asiaticum]|uniref:Uncharacterized protein n=1 Tax=Hyalomma asiaticum TaxID=266040 RepID=A0ACB7TLW0_HYAAI|nr:hypothetical protein HPB50_016645 [Hyalomma asiaticum]
MGGSHCRAVGPTRSWPPARAAYTAEPRVSRNWGEAGTVRAAPDVPRSGRVSHNHDNYNAESASMLQARHIELPEVAEPNFEVGKRRSSCETALVSRRVVQALSELNSSRIYYRVVRDTADGMQLTDADGLRKDDLPVKRRCWSPLEPASGTAAGSWLRVDMAARRPRAERAAPSAPSLGGAGLAVQPRLLARGSPGETACSARPRVPMAAQNGGPRLEPRLRAPPPEREHAQRPRRQAPSGERR